MPIYDNSYTNSYIRITGCVITYNLDRVRSKKNDGSEEIEISKDQIYNVQDCYTNKKYIYWNVKSPSVFEFSNKVLEKGLGEGRYLIVINDNGTHTEYVNNNNPEISISFDGGSNYIVEKKIWGVHEVIEELDGTYVEKFANISSDIDGIRQSVGKVETAANSIKETVSKIDQKSDAIISSVGETTKEFVDDELRNDVHAKLIKLAKDLGLLLSNIKDVYLGDLLLNAEEKEKILDALNELDLKKDDVISGVNEVLAKFEKKSSREKSDSIQDKSGEVKPDVKSKLISCKDELNICHDNLHKILNLIMQSTTEIGSENMTTMAVAFSEYNIAINNLKNAVDDAIIKTLGGSITENIGQIKVEAGKISQEVSNKVDGKEVISIIKHTPDAVEYRFNNVAGETEDGLPKVRIDNNGLTVNEGYIKTDALIPGKNRRIILEPNKVPGENNCMSIDTNYKNNAAIRLKYNAGNYLFINSDAINFFMEGNIVTTITTSGITKGINWSGITDKPPSYSPSSHNHNYDTKCSSVLPTSAGAGFVGTDTNPFLHIEAKKVWWQVNGGHSDIKRKENILPINEKSVTKLTGDISLEDMKYFVSKELKLYQYNFKGNIENDVLYNQIGFIANELADTKVGRSFIEKSPEIDEYVYNAGAYVSIIAGALQAEIQKREELEEQVNKLAEEISKLKGE